MQNITDKHQAELVFIRQFSFVTSKVGHILMQLMQNTLGLTWHRQSGMRLLTTGEGASPTQFAGQ